ncbi:MAG: DsbA family protein [Gammaproteobacteria bacterium]
MCSWCWAFRLVWMGIRARLPKDIPSQRVLGGLAPDTREPMPETMQTYIQDTWRRIERAVPPGHEVQLRLLECCQPRRSTYPACRAVIAAIAQGPEFEEPMIEAIQRAYYLKAQNPSDDETVIALGEAIGLDRERFARALNDTATEAELLRQIQFSRSLGARGFPSLILEDESDYRPVAYAMTTPIPRWCSPRSASELGGGCGSPEGGWTHTTKTGYFDLHSRHPAGCRPAAAAKAMKRQPVLVRLFGADRVGSPSDLGDERVHHLCVRPAYRTKSRIGLLTIFGGRPAGIEARRGRRCGAVRRQRTRRVLPISSSRTGPPRAQPGLCRTRSIRCENRSDQSRPGGNRLPFRHTGRSNPP